MTKRVAWHRYTVRLPRAVHWLLLVLYYAWLLFGIYSMWGT